MLGLRLALFRGHLRLLRVEENKKMEAYGGLLRLYICIPGVREESRCVINHTTIGVATDYHHVPSS